jgi:hypothetical protein
MLFVVNFRLVQKRVLDILNIGEIIPRKRKAKEGDEAIEMQEMEEFEEENAGDASFLRFDNYSGYWSKDHLQRDAPVLRNINLLIKKAKFTPSLNCIIGKIVNHTQ